MSKRIAAALAVVCALSLSVIASTAPAAAPPQELITNGSFETGDFTGWGTKDMAIPFFSLAVRGAGAGPGFGLFLTAPTDGSFVSDNGFDGCGPDTIEQWQDVTIPAGETATLTFDWRVAWDMFAGPTMDRSFDLQIQPGGGGPALETDNLVTTDIATSLSGDTGPTSSSFDLSAYQGSTIRIDFVETIPECFTGPGHMQLDNVSLLVQATFASVCDLVQQYSSKPGIANSLCAKLRAAAAASDRGQTKTMDNILNAFEHEVSAQSGKALTATEAETLIDLAEQLK
jgi:hypothetical protein